MVVDGACLRAGESAGGLSSIAEKEVARRQSLLTAASANLERGRQLLAEGKSEEAAQLLLDSYRSLPESPVAAEWKTALRDAFSEAACVRARELLTEARYAEAHQLLDTVLAADMNPTHEQAQKLKKQAGDPDRYPPALTPDHLAKVRRVEELLVLAASAAELGDHDKALAVYLDVLRLDATNVAARRGMERVEQRKSQYYEAAYDHTRSRMMNQVNQLWETPVPPSSDLTDLFASGRTVGTGGNAGGRERLMQKLRTLRVAKLDFSQATLEEVVEYLRITSRDTDPEGKGIGFILSVEDETKTRTVNLSISDVPLEEVVRYVTEMAGASFKVEDHAVVISSLTAKATYLITKTYRVPPDFIQNSDAGGAAAAPAADPFASPAQQVPGGLAIRRLGAKEFLESRGVSFTGDASASFSPATSTLIVRNTAENIALVDMLVEQSINNAPKQALITVRLLEVTEELMTDIHNEILLGNANLPGSERVFMSGGSPRNDAPGLFSTTEGIRSTGAIIGKPSIDQLLALSQGQEVPDINSRSPSPLRLLGHLTDPQFLVFLHAMKQKTGTDLVSVPSIVARSGQRASVRLVREFPYPTEFDPPEIPQQVSGPNVTATNAAGLSTNPGSGSIPITPTTPTTFEVKELGTVLEVEPVIADDGRTVEVSVTPSNTEFEGFIDYGSDITSSTGSSFFDPLAFVFVNTSTPFTIDNPILQPVFRKTGEATSVTIWDGNTIVIGGLVSEKVTEVNDKVPVLGDIPLVGKLWQGKAKQSIRKNVLITVTVKVIDPGGQPVNIARDDLGDTAMGGGR
jgi:general secretion pathway protein D